MTAANAALRLATLRVLVGAFAVVYLAVRMPVFLALARDRDGFDPVGVLAWLESPVTPGLWRAIVIAALAAGVLFVAGIAHRFVGPLFAIGLLVVTTYRSSWGQILWFENLMVLHVIVLACAPAGDALALRQRAVDPNEQRYRGAIALMSVITVVTYVLAGIAKLRIGGLTWLDGGTLRNHIAYTASRADLLGGRVSPIAEPLVTASWLLTPAAIVTVALELCAPVALAGGRLRTCWVAAMWAVHVGIALAMFVVFPYPLFLVAFASLLPVERLVPSRLRERSTANRFPT